MNIIDSHFHGYEPKNKRCWAEAQMSELVESGISFAEIGIDIADVDDMVCVMTGLPGCLGVAIGHHPKLVLADTDIDTVFAQVVCAVETHREHVLAVKTGLDYYWIREEAAHEKQRLFLRKMLGFANKQSLPAVLHVRSAKENLGAAHEDVLCILRDMNYSGKLVLHCFSGDCRTVNAYLELPAQVYFGIGGSITYPGQDQLLEALRIIPEDRMLLETDAPYIKPFLPDGTRVKGKRNTPLNLPVIINKLAAERGLTTEEVIALTTENARSFFD